MPGRPKKNRRKEQQELEVRAAKNGVGSVITRKGLVMHCKKCKKAGHNSRKCQEPEGNGNPPEPPQVPPKRTRRPREEQPAGERTMTRRVKCGKCKAFRHNARTCTFVPGVQAVVNPNTSARQQRREVRAAMDGVGVYQDTITGNMYYRVLFSADTCIVYCVHFSVLVSHQFFKIFQGET
ncbi:hypothetical protein LINPERHAP1_LOCUS10301, partial [Linum perenne]